MDFEKRLEEVAGKCYALAYSTRGDHPAIQIKDAFRPLLRQVWNEAIEAAKAVCEREGYEPDRTITDPQFAWLSACVVCGLEIDDLKEVD